MDDFNLEDTETFSVIISTSDPDILIPSPMAEVMIVDNDRVGLGLENAVYDTSEGLVSVEVCVVVTSGVIQRRLIVRVVTGDISAGTCKDFVDRE